MVSDLGTSAVRHALMLSTGRMHALALQWPPPPKVCVMVVVSQSRKLLRLTLVRVLSISGCGSSSDMRVTTDDGLHVEDDSGVCHLAN